MIVVTGGGDGIGRECALAYARQQATVVIMDYNLSAADRRAADLSTPGMASRVDVSDGAAVSSAMAAVMNRYGRIDAVHNNAGISSPAKPLHETSEEEWDRLQRNSVKSVYRIGLPYENILTIFICWDTALMGT